MMEQENHSRSKVRNLNKPDSQNKNENSLIEVHSSDEEKLQKPNKNIDLDYHYLMKPPNPLLDKDHNHNIEVKTAYKLNFSKLPSFTNKNDGDVKRTPLTGQIYQEDLLYDLERKKRDGENEKSLFALYPMGDSKEVYRKFTSSGDHEPDPRMYAAYIIDLNNLLKNKKKIKIQYANQEQNSSSHLLKKNSEHYLEFNSIFESGNLFSAFKVGENEYDLILQNDINTKGHTQWFFFSVAKAKRGQKVKFNIVNLLKPDSLFNQGMKPVTFSTHEGSGWKRAGYDISYFKNGIVREGEVFNTETYHTLTFKYEFLHNDDTVYFAHCYPYTYSDLNKYLKKIFSDPIKKNYLTRKRLCETLSKNECEYLTITSNTNIETLDQRLGVVITARQHPGETLSSYIMEGIINFLLSDETEAHFLRNTCVFKIIPMMNPDGVIHGNYRTCLSGSDLNRKWKKPQRFLHPTVYYAKELMREFRKTRNFVFYCDLHGHSRKKNAFIYGNSGKDPISSRLFPFLLSKMSKYVKFEDCRFAVQKSKESTARIALWKEHGIDNIFTLEGSFHGYTENDTLIPFTTEEYQNIGKDLCKSLCLYILQAKTGIFRCSDIKVEEPIKQVGFLQKDYFAIQLASMKGIAITGSSKNGTIDTAMLIEELRTSKKLIDCGNKDDDSGSDSNPSADDFTVEEMCKIVPKELATKLKANSPKKPSRRDSIVAAARNESKSQSKSQSDSDAAQVPPKKEEPEKPKIEEEIASVSSKIPGMTDSFCQTEEFIFKTTHFDPLISSGSIQAVLTARQKPQILNIDLKKDSMTMKSHQAYQQGWMAKRAATSMANERPYYHQSPKLIMPYPAMSLHKRGAGLMIRGSKVSDERMEKAQFESINISNKRRGSQIKPIGTDITEKAETFDKSMDDTELDCGMSSLKNRLNSNIAIDSMGTRETIEGAMTTSIKFSGRSVPKTQNKAEVEKFYLNPTTETKVSSEFKNTLESRPMTTVTTNLKAPLSGKLTSHNLPTDIKLAMLNSSQPFQTMNLQGNNIFARPTTGRRDGYPVSFNEQNRQKYSNTNKTTSKIQNYAPILNTKYQSEDQYNRNSMFSQEFAQTVEQMTLKIPESSYDSQMKILSKISDRKNQSPVIKNRNNTQNRSKRTRIERDKIPKHIQNLTDSTIKMNYIKSSQNSYGLNGKDTL